MKTGKHLLLETTCSRHVRTLIIALQFASCLAFVTDEDM